MREADDYHNLSLNVAGRSPMDTQSLRAKTIYGLLMSNRSKQW
jgi:hypothetical protein